MPSRQPHHRAWQRRQSGGDNDDDRVSRQRFGAGTPAGGTEAETCGGGSVVNDPFNLARAQLLARVAGPEVAANVLKLAYVIAYKHMNVESKTAVVGHKTLAADLNVTVRTIQGLLITLKTFGVAINRGAGRNKLSVYRIASVAVESEDAKTVSSLEVEKASPTAFVDAETAKPNSLFPEPNPPARTRRQVADGFAAFWQAYPAELRRARLRRSINASFATVKPPRPSCLPAPCATPPSVTARNRNSPNIQRRGSTANAGRTSRR